MANSANSLTLKDKVAIITGSGKETGIGAAIALTLARAGARVVINHISEVTAPRAAQVVTNIEKTTGNGTAIVVQADISTADGASKIINETLTRFGVDHIDILVNNAAVGHFGSILKAPLEDVINVFNVDVFGPIRLIQMVVPYMPKGGRIINIGSIASKLGIPAIPVYGAAKATLDTLTFSMSQELGHQKGITINTIAPGPVNTDSFPVGAPQIQKLHDWLLSLTRAEERTGTVDDIADVALFLASDKSRWITGQWISVSGGITGM